MFGKLFKRKKKRDNNAQNFSQHISANRDLVNENIIQTSLFSVTSIANDSSYSSSDTSSSSDSSSSCDSGGGF